MSITSISGTLDMGIDANIDILKGEVNILKSRLAEIHLNLTNLALKIELKIEEEKEPNYFKPHQLVWVSDDASEWNIATFISYRKYSKSSTQYKAQLYSDGWHSTWKYCLPFRGYLDNHRVMCHT